MRSVFLKEMLIYCTSPIIYVLALLISLVSGLLFFSTLLELSNLAVSSTLLHQQALLVHSLFLNLSLVMIVVCPLISMRLIAEERASGTLDLLRTYPLSPAAVVAGKYWASLSVTALLLGVGLSLCGLAEIVTDLDWALVLSSYLGVVLLCAAFLAVGLLASCLSASQIVAGLLALGLILLLMGLGRLGQLCNQQGLATVLSEIGLGSHLPSFLKGELRLKDLAYFIILTTICLSGASRLVERPCII